MEKFPYDPREGSFLCPPERGSYTAEAFWYCLDDGDAVFKHRTLPALQGNDGAGKHGTGTAFAACVCQSLQPLTTGNQASVQMPGDPAVEPKKMTKRHMAGARVFPSRVPQRGQVFDML